MRKESKKSLILKTDRNECHPEPSARVILSAAKNLRASRVNSAKDLLFADPSA